MAKNTQQLEERLARVEREIAEIKATLAGKPRQPWYRHLVGNFAQDREFAEIIRLGRLIRRGKHEG